MGWLRGLRKDTPGVDTEPSPVLGAGSSGDTAGASGVVAGTQPVVTTNRGSVTGTGSVNTVHHNGGSVPAEHSIIMGGRNVGVVHNQCALPGCGHGNYEVLMIAGSYVNSRVSCWVACQQCHMDTLWEMRSDTPSAFMETGEPCKDLIYTYLPSSPIYPNLGGNVYGYDGCIINMRDL